MIVFNNVSMRYPNSAHLFRQVSFSIDKGDFVLVTGHSGAGKSTLLKLMAGIELPSSGHILINQQDISQLHPNAVPYLRRRFGLVFQDHKLLYDRNSFDNVALPLSIQGITGEEAARRVRAALDKVGLLNKEKAMPITLSGGEQQRLAIARAVVSRPSIVIADEPTGGLDQAASLEIMQLLKAFNDVGVTVVIAMHDVSQVSSIAYRTLHIDQQTISAMPAQTAML
ncbi:MULTISPECIES: cell division ATP-binding protein FtsE [unclassified Methylophilus]|jgi:cell division transport system ATP-binding protein|uniref:cell division ATP-binding protein FtsE n=1 Tax=unclassified Methylophilus TaxID=2630143 RepID=UPI000467D61A|nr:MULTISPECIES: cell division ATP-binding protein FtsE [unclassified Methylophilus]HCU85413.1 cell division ATP-binding protein FtsE [Methylophilus sp.]